MEKSIKTIKNLAIINAIISVALIICLVVFGIHVTNLALRITELEENQGMSMEEQASLIPPGTEITEADKKQEIVDRTVTDLKAALESNTYFTLVMSDTENYDMIVTNEHGEAIYQDNKGQTLVYMDDGNSVYFADNVYYGADVTILHQLLSAFEAYDDIKPTIYESANGYDESAGGNIEEYCYDIHGWTELEKAFKPLGGDYASNIITAMRSSLELSGLNEDFDNINVRYSVAFLDGKLVGLGCYYYFGEDSIGAWADCAQDWLVASMFPVLEWKIPEEFINFEWDDIADADSETLGKQFESVLDEVQSMLTEFDAKMGFTGEDGEIKVDTSVEDILNGEASTEADDHEGHDHE